MNFRDKTKDELIKELLKLQEKYDSVRTSYEKIINSYKQAEERQAFVLRSIPLLIYYSETTDNYAATWISENVKHVTGFVRDVFLKETYFWSSRLHPDDRERVLRTFNELQENKQSAIEYRWQCANGEYHWFLDSFSSFKKTQEGKIEFIGVWLDITERKRAEETLRESEEHYKSIVQIMPDGVAIHTDGKVVFANKAANKIMNAKNIDQMVGISVMEFVHPDYREIVRQRINKSLSEHISAEPLEETFITFDGKPIQVNVASIPFLYLGKPSMLTVFTDITERKQTEAALRLEKENFRHSLDDSPLGVRIVTMEGNTIYANQAIIDIYGYDNLEELQKTPLKNRYTPESYIEAQERKRQRESGDLSATEYEISIVTKNGEIRHLQVYRNEILWDGVKQFQVIYNDITEHKQAEEEIRKSKKLLEDLYKHLNEIRESERLLISREIHDELGQSLTALKLDLNQMSKYISSNPEAVVKLEGMIKLISNTIKDVQRISSDLRPGILDDLGLVSAIEWYCDEFEKRTGIKCSLELDNSDYPDSNINLTFFRILQETLTNVIRHANASIVRIGLHKNPKGTKLSVKDNGIGISKEKIDSGESLGLISMHERVRQFNGKINIATKKGEGTKLSIFIPS